MFKKQKLKNKINKIKSNKLKIFTEVNPLIRKRRNNKFQIRKQIILNNYKNKLKKANQIINNKRKILQLYQNNKMKILKQKVK